jgi:hypothetical protein
VRILASLSQPHIAMISGGEETDGVRALVLELLVWIVDLHVWGNGRVRLTAPSRTSDRPTESLRAPYY